MRDPFVITSSGAGIFVKTMVFLLHKESDHGHAEIPPRSRLPGMRGSLKLHFVKRLKLA